MKPRFPSLQASFFASALLAGLCTLAGPATALRAQSPGSLDASFNAGAGPDGEFRAVALQPDGKIIVGGVFDTIDGTAYQGIARLNADGSLDTSFNPTPGIVFDEPNSGVYSVAVQPDGKIVIGGVFGTVNGAAHVGVARLNTDGTVDAGFQGNIGPGEGIRAVAVQADGKVLIGGDFDTIDGAAQPDLARLNTDGSLDTGFNANGAAGSSGNFVAAIVVQPDGKIIAGGNFDVDDGAEPNLLRLNTNGTVDASFNANGDGPDNTVYALALQADGKVVLGGLFRMVNDQPLYSLARLNADGSLDTTFNPNLGTQDFQTYSVAVQSDGKVLVGGEAAEDGIPGLTRLNADGSTDASYSIGTGVGGLVYALLIQPDNNLLVVGNFSAINETPENNIVRLIGGSTTPAFFTGQYSLGNGAYYLAFSTGNYFGYYSFLSDPHYIYHYDLGYEYVFDAQDGKAGVYLYDFKSSTFFYASPTFPFPYLYDFTLNTVLYYYPDPSNPGRYNTNGYRFFYDFNTQTIIVK